MPGLLNVWVPRDEMFLAMGDVLLHDGVLLLMCYVKLSALRQLLRYVVYVRLTKSSSVKAPALANS